MHGECITLLNMEQRVGGGGEDGRMGLKSQFFQFRLGSFSNHKQDSVLLLSSNVSQMILHYPTVLSF